MIDPYLRILILFVIACSAIIISFLLIIVLMRLFSSLNDKKYRELDGKWEKRFLRYICGDFSLDDTAPDFRGPVKFDWLRRFFQSYLENLDGKDFERTKDLCREAGMIHYYQKRLKLSTTAGKATAARILGSLRCQQSIPERLHLLQSKNPIVAQAAAQGLAVSGELDTFTSVAKALLNNTYFTYEGTTEILAAYGSDICDPILEMLREILKKPALLEHKPGKRKPKKTHSKNKIPIGVYVSTMIDLLGHYRCREALPVLNSLIDLADEEVTVHILKTYIRIGQLPSGYSPAPFLKHHYWVVRSFAAQTCQLSKDPGMIPELERLLDDRHWWVRYHAALALFKMGKAGPAILKRRASETRGNAADISRYVLERSVRG